MPLFWSIKFLIIYTFFLVCWQIYHLVGEEPMHNQISFSLVRSFSLTLPQCVPLSTSQSKLLFSSMPPLLPPWPLPEQHLFVGISLSFSPYNRTNQLGRTYSSFSLYNHINLFKIKVALLYFVGYATIVVVRAKSFCRSFF